MTMPSRTRVVLSFIVAIASFMLASCNNNAGDMLQPKGDPVLFKQAVGRTYMLSYVKYSPQWPSGTVPPNEMTLTIDSLAQIEGTFTCYVNGIKYGPAHYIASITPGGNNIIAIHSMNTSPSYCLPTRYFTFEASTMNYAAVGNTLEFSSQTSNLVANFVLDSVQMLNKAKNSEM